MQNKYCIGQNPTAEHNTPLTGTRNYNFTAEHNTLSQSTLITEQKNPFPLLQGTFAKIVVDSWN